MEIYTPDKNIAGQVVISGEYGRKSYKSYQCCHCGKHWAVIPSSGRLRGYCTSCKKVTCGAKKCDTCIPIEVKLDYQEMTNTPKTIAENAGAIKTMLKRYPKIERIPL